MMKYQQYAYGILGSLGGMFPQKNNYPLPICILQSLYHEQ